MVLIINCKGNPFDLFDRDVWRGGGGVDKREGAAGRGGHGNTPWGPLVVYHNKTTVWL